GSQVVPAGCTPRPRKWTRGFTAAAWTRPDAAATRVTLAMCGGKLGSRRQLHEVENVPERLDLDILLREPVKELVEDGHSVRSGLDPRMKAEREVRSRSARVPHMRPPPVEHLARRNASGLVLPVVACDRKAPEGLPVAHANPIRMRLRAVLRVPRVARFGQCVEDADVPIRLRAAMPANRDAEPLERGAGAAQVIGQRRRA